MLYWVKLHTDILHNPITGRFTLPEKGTWLALLALAGEIEDYDADGELTGRLDTLDNVAWHVRHSVEELTPIIEYFIQLGMLYRDADGVLYISDFAAIQARDTPAMRMQRYRRRKATKSALRERDADVTPPLRERDADVTPSLRERDADVTPSPHARNAAVTPPPYARNTAVTPPLRDVAESEQIQNRIRTEQQQQQNRTSTHNAVAAVDHSVDMRAAPMSAADMSADEDGAWTESDATWDVKRIQAYEELVALGVDTAMAAQLVQRHSLERVWALCEQLRQERAQGNAANTIIPRIARDRPPSHNLP